MTQTSTSSALLERLSRLQASTPRGSLTFEGVTAVELVVPDRQSAARLVETAALSFPAELVVDSGWIVRFRPPAATAADWVGELLALVEHWWKPVPWPCAKALPESKGYLVLVPPEPGRQPQHRGGPR